MADEIVGGLLDIVITLEMAVFPLTFPSFGVTSTWISSPLSNQEEPASVFPVSLMKLPFFIHE